MEYYLQTKQYIIKYLNLEYDKLNLYNELNQKQLDVCLD